MYEMKENYYTGIEFIDEGHKKLFQIIDSAYQIYEDIHMADKNVHCHNTLSELNEYITDYFADEEGYMETIDYKRIVQHKLQHQVLIEKIDEIMNNKDINFENTFLDFMCYLTSWMVDHILNMDKMISNFNLT